MAVDEEVTIETDSEHPEVLENKDPEVFLSGISWALHLISSYGWFILFGTIVLWLVKQKLEAALEKKRKSKDDYIDPDVAQARFAAMEAARRRMQEEHDAKTARWKEKQKLKEEQQRQQKIQDWENHKEGLGYRSKIKPPAEKEPSPEKDDTSKGPFTSSSRPRNRLRQNDYNPLLGPGAGGGYRPAPRGGFSGGG